MKPLGFFLSAFAVACAGGLFGQEHEPLPPEKPPQLLVDVSAGLLNAAVRESIDRVEPFNDVILETQVSGIQRTVAQVRAELAPDPCRGAFYIVVSGSNYARAIGQQERVLTHTNTVASFEVGHLIAIDGKGITRTCGPLHADADICLLCATGLNGDPDTLAAQLAPHAFRQQQRELQGIVAARTGAQAAQRLEEELTPKLVAGSKAVAQGLELVKEAGVDVDTLRFSTTSSHLQARVRVAITDGPEPGPAPPLPAKIDLGMRVHESLINEGARAALGGRTLRVTELIELSGQFTDMLFLDDRKGALNDALKAIEKLLQSLTDKQPTVTFAKKDPVNVRFTDDGFAVQAHLAKITFAGLDFGEARAKATYQVETKGGRVFVVRQGPIQFQLVDEKIPDLLALPYRIFSEAVSEELFRSRFSLADLAMPAQLSQPSVLAPSRIVTSKGWLTVGWKLREP